MLFPCNNVYIVSQYLASHLIKNCLLPIIYIIGLSLKMCFISSVDLSYLILIKNVFGFSAQCSNLQNHTNLPMTSHVPSVSHSSLSLSSIHSCSFPLSLSGSNTHTLILIYLLQTHTCHFLPWHSLSLRHTLLQSSVTVVQHRMVLTPSCA